MKLKRYGFLVWLGWAGLVHGQSVINWGGGSVPPEPAQAATAASDATRPVLMAPVPPPLPPPPPEPRASPTADVGAMAGYVQSDEPEPSMRLDTGRVSTALAALYAQRPGESESAYIARMGDLYRQAQSQLETTTTRNEAYMRSLAVPPRSASPPGQ